MFGLLPAPKEQTMCFKKMQGKLITMKEQLEHLDELLKFLQLRLESAPGVLDKEKTISSMTGSSLEAYCLWDDLSITEKDNCCTVFMDAMRVYSDGIQDLVSTVENCLDYPMPIMPIDFINIDTGLFARLMEAHENQLTLFYGEDALKKLMEARGKLIHEFQTSAALPMLLNLMMGRILINPGSIVEKNVCCCKSLLLASLA